MQSLAPGSAILEAEIPERLVNSASASHQVNCDSNDGWQLLDR